ncbi:YVTN beta-propeller repeat-containing protein [Caballeronia arationis]|nr:YVTN beta-propeller repeat-containing protein [Caballeronia arationis]
MAVGKEPHHLMATPDNQSLIVANSVANNLGFLDLKTGKVQRWLRGIEDPYQLGFSRRSHRLASAQNRETIHTDKSAHNFRSLANGQHVLVSNRVGSIISILDQNTLTNVGTINGSLAGPDDMELTPGKIPVGDLFLFNRYVGVIDIKTLKLNNTIRVGKSPQVSTSITAHR